MTRPRIGLTTYGPEGDALPSVSLPTAYVRAVALAGGQPVLLPPSDVAPDETLDWLDALVLTGGGDVDPAVHGAGSHPSVYGVVAERDAYELPLARAALARPELPLLGICRGMQVLNVAAGGDLGLHIPDARGESIAHRLPPREPVTHPVAVDREGPLAAVYGETEFPVCSWHHQEVRALGAGLRACARAADGVIEGLAVESHRFGLGVQWHPEMQIDDAPLQRRLFEALVRVATRK